MPLAAPVYCIGDVVYLRESAAIGFLESYKIQSVRYSPAGIISYTMETYPSHPSITRTVGDRVTGVHTHRLELCEDDLVVYCDALSLVKSNLTLQLANIQSKIDSASCPDVT